MFSLRTIALLTVLSISAAKSKEPYCTSALCGYVTSNVQDFVLVRVPTGPVILESSTKKVCGGVSAIGIFSKVCAADAFPVLDCVSATQVSITRTGSPYTSTTIRMQAFCLNPVSGIWRTAAIRDDDSMETIHEPIASAEPIESRDAN